MKKKIFGAALIAAMALTAGWNFNQSKNKVDLSDLALANAEALARGESDEWYSGYEKGEKTINGITIDCCVPSSSSNACNYGKIGCIQIK